jgi:hypothetical protein
VALRSFQQARHLAPLTCRRYLALGFATRAVCPLLHEFLHFLETTLPPGLLPAPVVFTWACGDAPPHTVTTPAARLRAVRGFLTCAKVTFPEIALPAPGLLNSPRRSQPYSFSPAELTALLKTGDPLPTRSAFAPLEQQRHNSVRSRNARMAALRPFFRWVTLCEPGTLGQATRVLAIPDQRAERVAIGVLTRSEMDALLATPDRRSRHGRRDYASLLTLYNSGARLGSHHASTLAGALWCAPFCVCVGKAVRNGPCPCGRPPPRHCAPGFRNSILTRSVPLATARIRAQHC